MTGNLKKSRSRVLALTELQRAFRSAILHPRREPPPFIFNSPKASVVRRFAIYSEAYRLRLIEALAGDYPALKEWLGEGWIVGISTSEEAQSRS
jgi:hypothetical protein